MTNAKVGEKILLMPAHWRDLDQMPDTLERTSDFDASNVVAIIRAPNTPPLRQWTSR